MNVLGAPKAIYKAQQAKKKMQQMQAAGQSGLVAVLLNGLNELVEVELNPAEVKNILGSSVSDEVLANLSAKLSEDLKKSFSQAKKQIEQLLMSSTSLDDLKDLLS
jgi:DNA-binding protein YbaB